MEDIFLDHILSDPFFSLVIFPIIFYITIHLTADQTPILYVPSLASNQGIDRVADSYSAAHMTSYWLELGPVLLLVQL